MPDPETPPPRASSGDSAGLAYALARICLGLNILLHGVVRMPHLDVFLAKLQKQFAATILPARLVEFSGYLIVGGEALIGFLVLVGWGLRRVLIAGIGLMLLLQLGTGLVQDWNAAGLQLTYVAFYAVLLAAIRHDRWSVDSRRR
jgi:thiosulfate dehydrogenase [quinone] large subunit